MYKLRIIFILFLFSSYSNDSVAQTTINLANQCELLTGNGLPAPGSPPAFLNPPYAIGIN